jgi:glycosyltransferase involved in cell wall biosynthesis
MTGPGRPPSARPHVGILANDAWVGGVVYTQNLVRALSSLPVEERPKITFLQRCGATGFESLMPLVEGQRRYRLWFGDRDGGALRSKLNSFFRAACGVILGESLPEVAWSARQAGVEAVYPVVHPRQRLIPRPIGWIPDLQHRALPELFTPAELHARDRAYGRLLSQPGDVIFSSEHARADAVRAFGRPVARTHVLRFATVPDDSWYEDPTPVRLRYGLHQDYIIVCNQFWAHKGHRTVFEAVRLLTAEGWRVQLVCTGPTEDARQPRYFADLRSLLRAWGIEPQVHVLGLIPRHDQIQLMYGASAVIQPSLFEGWSTVLEDARALGKAVVASDFPVHLEQDLPHAIYFRRGNGQDCARAIREHFRRREDGRSHLPFDRAAHRARILEFARSFLRIVAPDRHVVAS